MLTDEQLQEIQTRVMGTARLAGVKPFEDDLALLMIDLKGARLTLDEMKKQAALEGEGIAFLRHDLQEANRLIGVIRAAWEEHKAAVNEHFPTGDFGEDEIRSERVSTARKRLGEALDALLPPDLRRDNDQG